MRSVSARALWLAALFVGLAIAPVAARATVITGASTGYDLSASGLINSTSINTSPLALASGSAPPYYNQTVTPLNPTYTATIPVDSVGSLVITLTPTSDQATASSDVDGTSGNKTTMASSIFGNPTLSVVFDPTSGGSYSLFDLQLPITLSASAQVTGDYNNLSATGSGVISTGSMWGQLVGSTTWDLSTFSGTNVVAYQGNGVTVVLNEQTTSCTASDCSISVNALHLTAPTASFDGLTFTNLDVIVGHADAYQTATLPEPGIGLLLFGGLAALAGLRRRSPRKA